MLPRKPEQSTFRQMSGAQSYTVDTTKLNTGKTGFSMQVSQKANRLWLFPNVSGFSKSSNAQSIHICFQAYILGVCHIYGCQILFQNNLRRIQLRSRNGLTFWRAVYTDGIKQWLCISVDSVSIEQCIRHFRRQIGPWLINKCDKRSKYRVLYDARKPLVYTRTRKTQYNENGKHISPPRATIIQNFNT